MTIEFNCPNCDALIAFGDVHAGKGGKCTTCGEHFIIPSKSFEKVEKVELPEEKGFPIPGFYHAVFVDSWKIFVDRANVTPLVFVLALVCFKFFLGRGICCMNYFSTVIIWGLLLGFYLNIIYETAFGEEQLPEIFLGGRVSFIWNIIKPILIFSLTMFAVQLPFIVVLSLLKDKGINYVNMWQGHSGFNLLLQILFVGGVFFFPIAILTTAIGKDFTLLRPDYLIRAVFKASAPYLLIVALLVAGCLLNSLAKQFEYSREISIVLHTGRFALNIVVQIVLIIAMRSIGLFYRHYNCYLGW